jgi:hypothetical protein
VMVCRGTVDGVRGRLGPTVPVDGSDRPAPQQPEGVGRVP